jgi:hypothetical protein
MYSIARLETLADDTAFRTAVRDLATRLLASGAVRDHRRLVPLVSYSRQHPGVALRLLHLDGAVDLTSVDPELVDAWARLLPRVEGCRD